MKADYDQSYFENNGQLNDRPALRWYARVCDRLLRRCPGRVFEFGCGVGWLLRHLSARHAVAGYDLSEFCRQQARARVPSAAVYDDMQAVPARSFDLVVSLHVLEHVPDPPAVLRQLAGLLRRGGKLLYVVPAVHGLGHRIKDRAWFAYRDDTHVSLLPEERWRALTEAAGLRVLREAGDGLWDAPYVSWLPRVIQAPLFGVPAALQVYAGGGRLFIPARWGECLIVVAQAPASSAAESGT
jgi:SAM-dependent methyltransferase